MKSKIQLMNLVVSCTLILLAIGATLVVLGVFNALLNWDIFGPRLEAVLYGLFGSCMALAAFGTAMTIILALQESVRDFKKFVQARTNQADIPDAPKRAYAARMMYLLLAMVGLIALCNGINYIVLAKRCAVFKRLAAEQVGNFQDKISGLVAGFQAPPRDHVPRDLYEVLRSVSSLEFVQTATLYLPDPEEGGAMWGYTAWRNSYSNEDGFARFYVAKDFERAMRQAVDGDPADLEDINRRNEFIWYRTLAGPAGRPASVIRIDGNPRHSFREYRLDQ